MNRDRFATIVLAVETAVLAAAAAGVYAAFHSYYLNTSSTETEGRRWEDCRVVQRHAGIAARLFRVFPATAVLVSELH